MEDEKLMSQAELAEKYGTDTGTISLALRLYEIKPAEMMGTKRRRTGLYNERDAVEALIKLYEKRKLNHYKMLQEWQARIERMKVVYEKGA